VAQCADTNQIEVVVKNYGILPLTSFWIYWSWTGNSATGPLDSMQVTASPGLIAGADTTLYLDDVIMTTGAPGYNFTAYTSLPNNVTDESFDNDTMHYYTQTAMDGIYTIGGATPDFATFSDAVAGLNVFGVCGPVTFHARGGTYTEQVTMGDIVGVSSTNTVMFTTDPANTNPVKIEYTSTGSGDQGVITLSGASWVSIDGYDIENKGGSYSNAIYVDGGSSNIAFMNNTLTVPTGTSSYMRPVHIYNYNVPSENISVINNTISGGYYGIYAYNYNNGSAGCDGMNIIGNNVTNAYYYGIYCYYNKNVVMDDNIVDVQGGSASQYSYGNYM
jgi:hypothetical protein